MIPQSAPSSSDGTTSSTGSPGLARELTAKDGFAIVAGSVIGSGIFLVPGTIADHLVSLPAVLAVWFLGGMLSLFGALSLAELGSMFPAAGGLYVYLRNAYGRPIAFLYGWGLVIMIQTGTIATLAAGFSLYLSQMVSLSQWQQKLLSIASILALTGFNLMSLRKAKQLQNAGNAAKLLGLALLGAFLFWRGHAAVLHVNWTMTTKSGLLAYGVALIAVLWAYEGWHVVSFTASEFRAPQRDLPRSLVAGTLIVSAIYLVINLAYYSVLNAHSLAGMPSAAAGAVQQAYGSGVLWLVSLLILVSILGAMNGMILTGPRVYYAMARDRMFFRFLARTTERSRVPVAAILVQGLWAAALVLTGNFQQLFTSVVFTAWIFYGLTVAGVIVLRIRYPQQRRPFRTPGYPLVPLLFVIAAGAVVWSTIATMPGHAAIGISAILAGLPLFFLFRSRLAHDQSETPVAKIEQ